MSGHDRRNPFERKWFRLGVAIAFLHAAFTALVLLLLGIDQQLALTVAVVVGTAGTIGLVVFIRYYYS
ncbi:MAG: hypothetical protein ACQETB_07900 [Halobacteriota archaeon]